ncbi:Mu transposase C-terminal domain-containing protein [Pseudomonas nicosulfuronedens]
MTKSTLLITPGSILEFGGQHVCVIRLDTAESVLVTVVETGEQRSLKIGEISKEAGRRAEISRLELSQIDPEVWRDAMEKFFWLEPLMYRAGRTEADVQQVADELLVSRPTIYRWLGKLEDKRNIRCLFRKRRGDVGTKRLSAEIEAVMERIIREKYLTTLKRSPTKTYAELETECRSLKLRVPSKGTLLRRIDEIMPSERTHRREGEKAALRNRVTKGSNPGVKSLYSLWQIDHTQVDLELVDSVDRIPIGRPWITVVIDTYSRMVVGWYVSFDPPGSLGTGLAITNAILSKDQMLARLGVTYPWPCQGKPRVIQADNAKEFQGEMLSLAAQEHGFQMRFRKKSKPTYGAHIERYLGTLAREIHTIDGTTFSNSQMKADYDSAGNAIFTLHNFEVWLAHTVLGEYHHHSHSGLEKGLSPIACFNIGLLGDEKVPGLGILPLSGTPDQLRLDFLPVMNRTVQTYGVMWDYITYYDSVLDRWVGVPEPRSRSKSRQFLFRYDPRDISRIYFWEPELKKYFVIPYRNTSRPPISYWEAKAVRRLIELRGIKDINEDLIFSAREARRDLLKVATALTRQAAKERERNRGYSKVGALLPDTLDSYDPDAAPSTGTNTTPTANSRLQNLKPFDEVEEV